MRSRSLPVGFAAIFILALTVFSTPHAAAQQETVLYNFGNGKDGCCPYDGLIFDAAANLYGTAPYGGTYGWGAVFELMPTASGGWTEKVLHNFSNAKDGVYPFASLISDASGNLYGTTALGGAHDYGTVFELTLVPGGGWTEKILHSFNLDGSDGTKPFASLILDPSGNLYGTTFQGGIYGGGTVFELIPPVGGVWTEKVLHSFNTSGKAGVNPFAELVLDAHGNLYGTTTGGDAYLGASYGGTVFQLTPTAGGGWTQKVLHTFINNNTDGYSPYGGLIFDAAGNLYGTTAGGGAYVAGTVYEMTPHAGVWTETILHSFRDNGSDGCYPFDHLILDSGGNLYGTTFECGAYGNAYGGGAAFKLTATVGGAWTETVLHNFGNGTDGNTVRGGLIADVTGNLYGTSYLGGLYGGGTVFEITP